MLENHMVLPQFLRRPDYTCELCEEPTDERTRLGDMRVCGRCYWARGCTKCREHVHIAGDDFCAECLVKFYTENAAEFIDALPWLNKSDEGRAIAERVSAKYYEVPA